MSRVEGAPQQLAHVVTRPHDYTGLRKKLTEVDEWTEVDLMIGDELRETRVVNKWFTEWGYKRRVNRKEKKLQKKADRINRGDDPDVMTPEVAASIARMGPI